MLKLIEIHSLTTFFLLKIIIIAESVNQTSSGSYKKILADISEDITVTALVTKEPNFEDAPLTSTWNNKTTLPLIQPKANTKTLCPAGMTFDKHFLLGTPFCYILTEKQRFPPECPYPSNLDIAEFTKISEKFQNQSIWLRAKRNTDDGFGEFEWLEPSLRYKYAVKDYENPVGDIMKRKCMIRKFNKDIPVFCDEEHSVLCIYSYASRAIGKFCSRRSKFPRCISTSLNLDNQCYCLANVEGMDVSRNDFCAKLAEPLEPFQNHLLLTELTNKSPCWIGLENFGNDSYRWSSSNRTIDYTYWKENADMFKRYGAIDYSKPQGWILNNNYELKCAVCETDVEYQNVTIQLRYLPNVEELEIFIENVFDVYSYFTMQYLLVCFTDANVDGLNRKIVSTISDLFGVNDPYITTLKIDNYYPSYFWCETYRRPNLTLVVSNKVLAYKDIGKHGHEYALIVKVAVPKGIDPYLRNLHVETAKLINNTLHNKTNLVNAVRPMKVLGLSEKEEYMTLLLHMSSTKNSLGSEEERKGIRRILDLLPKVPSPLILSIDEFARSEVCLANTTKSGEMVLHWPETKIGVTTSPREMCLMEDFTPVVRTCEGDFLYGGRWGKVQGKCDRRVNVTQTTVVLYELMHSEEHAENLSKRLHDITTKNKDMLTVDVHFITKILEKLCGYEDINITEVSCTLSNMMGFNRSVLEEAQTLLNSTDKTLYILDKICSNVKLLEDTDYFHVETEKIFIQVSNLRTSNVTGALIRRVGPDKENASVSIEPLYNDISLEEVLKDKGFDAAVVLPLEHIKEIEKCMNKEQYPEIKLIITFFYDDTLFNEIPQEYKHYYYGNSRIIGVYVPGSSCTFHVPINVILKPSGNESKISCGHWHYGTNDVMESIYGKWNFDSNTNTEDKDEYAVCQYNHTTHFALLMFYENRKDDILPRDELVLDIITAIGCALSLLGLAGIFITAIAFKKWRRRSRNVIMLNFSASLAAQMILLFVADNVREDSALCFISGASLHYTVLSEFAWMLMIAILQYRKFVLVFQKPIPCLILKSIIFGWFLPLIPILVLFTTYPETYAQNSFGLCYPNNEYFLYGVALPIGVIILINLIVFLRIILNICNRKIEVYGSKDNDIKLQVLLAILLFFLLGMSWLFGLANTFLEWRVLSYLFCLTATLQGFVIFLFFIIMNKQSRSLWLNIKQICLCTKTNYK